MADRKKNSGGGVVASEQLHDVSTAGAGGGRRGAAGGAGGAIHFTDNGGVVLQNARVVLIFWGSAWTGAPVVSAASIINAAQSIVSGPYMDLLNQYRNINHATIQSSVTVSTAVGSSAANPPNPFSDADVATLVSNLINAGTIPGPATNNQLLYMVFLPSGVASSGAFIGEHTYFSYNGTNCHYAWVTTGNSLDSITSVFSHELVESVTDPEGSAIMGDAGSCTQGGWCEIGDVCYSNMLINGVTVQRYWSQADGGCMPTKTWKDTKDTKDTKDHKEVKDPKELKDHKEHKEWKEPKEFKDHKEFKEFKEPKEFKDHKEFKEFKEIEKLPKREGKEFKEPKEIYEGLPPDILGDPAWRQMVTDLTQRIGRLEESVATGRAFIRPEERPSVGDQALRDEEGGVKGGGAKSVQKPKR